MTIAQAFGLFLDDQYLKGNSLHTITDYTNKLRPFLEEFGERELAIVQNAQEKAASERRRRHDARLS